MPFFAATFFKFSLQNVKKCNKAAKRRGKDCVS